MRPHVTSWRRFAAAVSLAALPCAPALAANGLVATVPEAAAGAMVLDGWCVDSAYSDRSIAVLLWPASAGGPAGVVKAAWQRDGLWVCVSGLPSSATGPLNVSIDPAGGRGGSPATNVVRLELTRVGARLSFRGAAAGGGFVRDEALDNMWSAAVSGVAGGGPWTGEMMISAAVTGTLAGGVSGGIRTGLDGVAGANTAWPPQSPFDAPRSWATVEMAPSIGSQVPPHLDAKSISQGLTWDATSSDPYLFIAGKTTLVRAQISGWPLDTVTTASCVVAHYFWNGSQWVPDTTTTMGATWSGVGTPQLNGYQTSRLDGQPTFDCWVGPSLLASPGLYDFSFAVAVNGGPIKNLFLGSRELVQSQPFKLLVTPRINSKIPTLFQPFDVPTSSRLATAMQYLRRSWPVGDTKFPYLWAPLHDCTQLTDGLCDAQSRSSSDIYVAAYNNWAVQNGVKRIDKAVVAAIFPAGNGGGQSCWKGGASPTSGAIVTPDATDPGAITIAQEVAHCLGQVDPVSPNADPNNNVHSLHLSPPLPAFDQGFVDTIGRTVGTWVSRSVMFPSVFTGNTDDVRMIFEGYEFNDLYAKNQGLPYITVSEMPGDAMLEVVGTLDVEDVYVPTWGALAMDVASLVPPPAPDSPYALVLQRADGSEIVRYAFDVDFEETHGDADLLPLTFVVPAPDGLASYAIVKGEATLFASDPSAPAPAVAIRHFNPGRNVRLTWSGRPGLRYQVVFDHGDGGPVLPLVTGIADTSYVVPASQLPPGRDARLRVVASNGFATASDTSRPFDVNAGPSIVTILSPRPSSVLVAGRGLRLAGAAQSPQGDPVDAARLRWTVDDEFVGTGAPTVTLGPGDHVIQLRVEQGGAMSRAREAVRVLADRDHDGLPDSYEAGHACLNPDDADASGDADGDGLTSTAEFTLGTNPCHPDSNGDGVSDGDSVQLGIVPGPVTPPHDPRPDGPFWLLSTPVGLVCGSAEQVTVNVEAASPSTTWRARSNSPAVTVALDTHTGPGPLMLTAACGTLSRGSYPAQVLLSAAFAQGTPGFMDATRLLDVTVVVP